MKKVWQNIVFVWKNGTGRDRMDILNVPLAFILFFVGYGIIIWKFGWWLALGLFLILWMTNINLSIKKKRGV